MTSKSDSSFLGQIAVCETAFRARESIERFEYMDLCHSLQAHGPQLRAPVVLVGQ